MMRRTFQQVVGVSIALAVMFLSGCKSKPEAQPEASMPAPPACPEGAQCCGRLASPCPSGFGCSPHGTCESTSRVWVPASPFWMGCNASVDRTCEADEKPYHWVMVPAFALDRLEVTRAQYAECVAAKKCRPPQGPGHTAQVPQAPVTMIDWYQARDYCRFRGGRLPSEAEWEKAARGGCELYGERCDQITPVYAWGNGSPNCQRVSAQGGCEEPIGPVGRRPAGRSPYGALDMAGSVWEWVEDCGHPDYTGAPRDGTAWVTPCENDVRIDRGGRNGDMPTTLRASNRSDENARNPIETVGVRCAYDL